MASPNAETPATDETVNGRQIADPLGGKISLLNNQIIGAAQVRVLRAEISGSNRCQADGITARGASPVLNLCRKLIKAGFDPARPLEAYRGDTLCLTVRTIGEGAALTVDENGPRFAKWKAFSRSTVSPPVHQNNPTGAEHQVGAE